MADYRSPFFLFNRHLETIYPSVFRSVEPLPFMPIRIDTPDGDFLDLFMIDQLSQKAVIICHGLEGNAQRPYVTGMARALFLNGFDVVTWNFRGCGPEMNRRLRFYHSGATDDLDVVVQYVLSRGYREISLVGFSLGGNLTLKYAGENHGTHEIKKVVAISVPLDLWRSSLKISQPSNLIYSRRFLNSLKEKVIRKSKQMEGLEIKGIEKIRTLIEFDDHYTAPLHGFQNARHYYDMCSSLYFLPAISIPALIINAKNDPFLSKECYPDLKGHNLLAFQSPVRGGHVGFAQFTKNGLYWSEERAAEFLTTQV